MTPYQKLKHLIIEKSAQVDEEIYVPFPIISSNIDEIYDELFDNYADTMSDISYELREGEVETDILCDYSRHYETKSVAVKTLDGSYVGWTYFFGGGKHSEPEAVPWKEYSYNLDCHEEEKLVVVRTFKKI